MDSRTQQIRDSSLRVLLWDLDGTLVRGARYGIFKDYTVPMLESVFGTAGCLHEMIVSGMTDLQIVEEALRGEGITREQISARKDELQSCYIAEMKRATGNGAHVIEAMPGAREVLQRVQKHPRYASALLTGNIKPAAYLKLEITGLSEFFQLPGAFGDESFDRRDLPAIAAQRINEHLGANLHPEQFITAAPIAQKPTEAHSVNTTLPFGFLPFASLPNRIPCAFNSRSNASFTSALSRAEQDLPVQTKT